MGTSSATILLAEDDEIVRESLRLLLESNGFALTGVRVLIPSSSAPINDAVLAGYIEEEMGLPLAEDQAVAPPAGDG